VIHDHKLETAVLFGFSRVCALCSSSRTPTYYHISIWLSDITFHTMALHHWCYYQWSNNSGV